MFTLDIVSVLRSTIVPTNETSEDRNAYEISTVVRNEFLRNEIRNCSVFSLILDIIIVSF